MARRAPRIRVEPSAIAFADACVGVDTEAVLTVHNDGDGALNLTGYALPAGTPFAVRDPVSRLLPGRQSEVSVVFRPPAPEVAYTATLALLSDDPETPQVRVALSGQAGGRDVAVEPAEIDFGVVNEGAGAVRDLTIRNRGGGALTVQGLSWTSTSVDLGPTDWPSVPVLLAPKTSTTVRLRYDPRDLGADAGRVAITTDDPDEPRREVLVRGVANLAPRAVAWACDRQPGAFVCGEATRRRDLSAGLGRVLRLDGLASFDPEGGPIASYAWTVEARPRQSRAAVFHSSDDRDRGRATGELEVDRVGRYAVRLTVQDERGLSSDRVIRPESRIHVRPKDLEVRLTWDIATDLDLHLVRPGGRLNDYGTGRVGTSTGTDCSTFNRGPDWGVVGDASDDPRLDKDDVRGRGPEVVSLDFPETHGPYVVYAHYCDSRDVGVEVFAAVDVRARGQVVAVIPTQGGFRLDPGEVLAVAEVRWQDGQALVSPRNEPPVLRPDLCRSF